MQKPSKKLQRQWQAKLKQSGFVDIEDVDSPREMLKRWDSTYFINLCTPDQFHARVTYFSNCRDFLNKYKFLNKLERNIWYWHAEGLGYREIAKKTKHSPDNTLKTINRLKGFMQGLKLRNNTPEDKAFIYSTWLRGTYYGSDWMKSMSKKAFFKNYPPVLDKLLLKPSVRVVIACLPLDSEQSEPDDSIVGYAVYESETNPGALNGVLHWVYVKDAWRKQGVLTQLIDFMAFKTASHTTKIGESIMRKKGIVFNPFII